MFPRACLPAFVLLAALPLALVACGSGDEAPSRAPVDEETVRQIAGVAELATNAYAAAGAGALHDYLAPEVARDCSQEDLARALAGSELPSGFRKIEDVALEPDRKVRARIVQLFGDEERSVEWLFARVDGRSWRLIGVPGLEECSD